MRSGEYQLSPEYIILERAAAERSRRKQRQAFSQSSSLQSEPSVSSIAFVEEPESQSEDEPGQETRGSRWRGRGTPMTRGRVTKARELHDGAGLRSPGRWIPEQRHLTESEILEEFRETIKKNVTDRLGSDLFAKLACGRVKDCPFEGLEKNLGKSVSAVREARSRSQEKT